MKLTILLTLVLGVLVSEAFAQKSLAGKLDKKLQPKWRYEFSIRFDPVTDAKQYPLPLVPATGDSLFHRAVKWPPEHGAPLHLILLESPGKPHTLFADLNRDGKFTVDEQFVFEQHGDNEVLRVNYPNPVEHTIWPVYPVTFRYLGHDGSGREVQYSNIAYLTGSVRIGKSDVKIQTMLDAATGQVDRIVGMDTNGDGTVELDAGSPENDATDHGLALYKVGARAVSIHSFDLAHGTFAVDVYPASKYNRIELRAGNALPDFSFTDIQGTVHHLSEYRGKYVLLDFWGSWCEPCVADVPELKKLYAEYHEKGLEIIGMNNEAGFEDWDTASLNGATATVTKFVADHGLGWPMATTGSVLELARDRFRVRSYPMKILLDPNGNIVLVPSDLQNANAFDVLREKLKSISK